MVAKRTPEARMATMQRRFDIQFKAEQIRRRPPARIVAMIPAGRFTRVVPMCADRREVDACTKKVDLTGPTVEVSR